MSEYLKDVTNLLNYKNIISPIELPQMPVPELDPVTKMCIILPESHIIKNEKLEAITNDRIEVVRVPFNSDEFPKGVSPATIEVNIMSSDGKLVGFNPSDDPLFKPRGDTKFIREMIIPNSEQISIRNAVNDNADHIIHDYFGLDPDEYCNNNGFDLFKELPEPSNLQRWFNRGRLPDSIKKLRPLTPEEDYETFDKLRFRVYVQTKLAYRAIMDKIRDEAVQTDLLPENLIILNRNEIVDVTNDRDINIKKLGSHGLTSGLNLIRDALKRI